MESALVMGTTVFHICFPNYYVLTDDPWELAERAAKATTKPDLHDSIEIDGEADYVISAVIYDDPSLYDDYDPDADYSDWESGPAPWKFSHWAKKTWNLVVHPSTSTSRKL
jgi:hypothetical protein